MNKSTPDATSATIALLVLFTAALFLQACEVIYTSSIIIPKTIEAISTDTDEQKNDEHFNAMFDEYCSHKKFQIEPVVEPLQDDSSVSDLHTGRKSCSTEWSYSAILWNHPTAYEIELSLIQPWSLWNSGKQERFFCSETRDMFDFFKTGLMHEKATYKPYASCPEVKVQQ